MKRRGEMCSKSCGRSLKSWSCWGTNRRPLQQNPLRRNLTGASCTNAVFVLLLSFLVVYHNHVSNPSPFKENRKVSSILRDLVEYVREINTMGLKYNKLLIIDPFAELIQAEVMPVHNKMSSLKRQVRIYEGMERTISPTNNESSFREINFIDETLDDCESQYRGILYATKKDLARLRRELQDMYTKLPQIIDDNTLDILEESGIYLGWEPEPGTNLSPTTTLDEVIELISEVADLFEEWELGFGELTEVIETQNITLVRQTYGTPVFSLLKSLTNCRKEIDSFLQKNEQYIRSTFNLLELQLEERRRDEERIVAVQNGFKRRYERMTEMLAGDILSTRERVKNLRFPSKKSEL